MESSWNILFQQERILVELQYRPNMDIYLIPPLINKRLQLPVSFNYCDTAELNKADNWRQLSLLWSLLLVILITILFDCDSNSNRDNS